MPPPPRSAGTRRSRGRSGSVSSSSSWRPAADDHAVLEHEDLVGVADRGDPLGHDHHGRVAGDRPQRRTQPRVGGEVEGREGVVEQVDLRAAISARAIASRCRWPPETLVPPWAIGASSPSGMRLDEVARLGDLEGRPQLLVGGVGLAVAQVASAPCRRTGRPSAAPARSVDQSSVRLEVAYVDPVDQHRARRWRRTAAGTRLTMRGLAGAGRADDARSSAPGRASNDMSRRPGTSAPG